MRVLEVVCWFFQGPIVIACCFARWLGDFLSCDGATSKKSDLHELPVRSRPEFATAESFRATTAP